MNELFIRLKEKSIVQDRGNGPTFTIKESDLRTILVEWSEKSIRQYTKIYEEGYDQGNKDAKGDCR